MQKRTKKSIIAQVEETDTFAGDPNYNWVHRFVVSVKTDSKRAVVRAVNKRLGYRRMYTYNYGDMIEIRPVGLCRVAFVTFTDDKR